MAEKVNRPTGVTIIAILTIIIGIIAIFGGLSLVVFGVFLSAAPISLTENSNTTTITDDTVVVGTILWNNGGYSRCCIVIYRNWIYCHDLWIVKG